MLTTTEGIVLKRVAYSSSSAIATIYTRKYGQTAFMVRGIGKKGGKSALLQPLTRVGISFHYREKNQIQNASGLEIKPGSSFYVHPLKGTISMFLAEVLFKALREESPDEDLYDFLDGALDYFSTDEFSPNFHLILLVKLTRFFGFYPSGKWSSDTPYFDMINGSFTSDKNSSLHMIYPDLGRVFYEIANRDFNKETTKMTNIDRRKLLYSIIEYYQIQLEGLGEIKSLPVLIEIFSGE